MWVSEAAGSRFAHGAGHHKDEEVRHSPVFVQRHSSPAADCQPQPFVKNKVDHRLRHSVVGCRDAAVKTSDAVLPVDVAYQPERGDAVSATATSLHT